MGTNESGNANAIDVPRDLRHELDKDIALGGYFDSLPRSHKREHIKWIEEAKKPETRARRIEKALEAMREKSADRR